MLLFFLIFSCFSLWHLLKLACWEKRIEPRKLYFTDKQDNSHAGLYEFFLLKHELVPLYLKVRFAGCRIHALFNGIILNRHLQHYVIIMGLHDSPSGDLLMGTVTFSRIVINLIHLDILSIRLRIGSFISICWVSTVLLQKLTTNGKQWPNDMSSNFQ